MNFSKFLEFICQLRPGGHNYCQFFFVIFVENDFLNILVEFESDRMSLRESAKNGRIGAHGFEIYDKIYPMKKISYLSDDFEIFVIQPGRSLPIVYGP